LGDKFIKPETENTASVHEKLIKWFSQSHHFLDRQGGKKVTFSLVLTFLLST
jgi:hypothetical protein